MIESPVLRRRLLKKRHHEDGELGAILINESRPLKWNKYLISKHVEKESSFEPINSKCRDHIQMELDVKRALCFQNGIQRKIVEDKRAELLRIMLKIFEMHPSWKYYQVEGLFL